VARARASAEQRDPEYHFSEDNPFLQHENPFAEGQRCVRTAYLSCLPARS
jgi:hypothetical protein